MSKSFKDYGRQKTEKSRARISVCNRGNNIEMDRELSRFLVPELDMKNSKIKQ